MESYLLLTDNEFFYAWYEQMKPQLRNMYIRAIKRDPDMVDVSFAEFCDAMYEDSNDLFDIMN